MKKIIFVALIAIAAATFMSCGNSTPKADLKSDVDSMSYAMGMSQTQGLKDFLVSRMKVDTTYMDDFIKGLNDGAKAGDDKKQKAKGMCPSADTAPWLIRGLPSGGHLFHKHFERSAAALHDVNAGRYGQFAARGRGACPLR